MWLWYYAILNAVILQSMLLYRTTMMEWYEIFTLEFNQSHYGTVTYISYINSLNMLGNLPHITVQMYTDVPRVPYSIKISLVGGFNPSEIWKSAGIIIPNYWKVIKFMFQTNISQLGSLIIPNIWKVIKNMFQTNMKVSWDHYSQYMESHKNHVPNHQPARWLTIINHYYWYILVYNPMK